MATYEDYTEKTDLTFDGTYQLIGNDPSDATEDGYWYITADNLSTWFTGELDVSDIVVTDKSAYDADIYFIGNETTDGNIKMTLPNLISVIAPKIDIKDMTLTDQPTYEALLYFVGSNGTTNKKMTLPNLISVIAPKIDIKDMTLTDQPTYEALLYFVGSNGTTNKKMTLPNLISTLTATANGLDLDLMFDSGGYQPLSGGQYQTTIADANVNNTVTTFAEAKTAIDALGTKINEIIVALETIGLIIT